MDMSDAEREQAVQSYEAHLARLAGRLPPDLATLATEITLHDAVICRVVLQRWADRLLLQLCCGDLQVGYFDLDLTYLGVEWDRTGLDVLARRARDRRTEILNSEVDLVSDGLFQHAILFWPQDDMEIWFSGLDLVKRPRADRSVPAGFDPFYEEEPD